MIRIARHEPSKNEPSQSSLEPNSGGWVDMATRGLSQSVHSIERFVAQQPAFCLGAALSVGVVLGWWAKRP
jgi:hypothetical protein